MADRRSLTLLPLIGAGVLVPGECKLSCSVGGTEYFADLRADGTIFFENEAFRSPSSFSVFVKRKLNPRRIADDGWTSVKYCGTVLKEFKTRFPLLGPSARPKAAAVQAATNASPAPVPQARRRKTSKRSRPAYEQSETTAEQSSEGASDADGFFENLCSDAEPLTSTGGRTSSTGSQDQATPSRQVTQRPTQVTEQGCLGLTAEERSQQPQGKEHPSGFSAQPWTFVQCDIKACQKWRRVITSDVPEGPWTCGMNHDPEYDSCSIPQQHSEADMQMLMEEQWGEAHAASCKRPPLSQCSEADFYADLTDFLDARGETSSARTVRERRIQCNNTPLDTMGLYREVVRRGGLAANERYDDHGRWTGSINFAGQIFPNMSNFTHNHRATSVGNQLLQNYRKFLASYEEWHQHDITPIHAAASFEDGQDRLAFLAGIISDQEVGHSFKDEDQAKGRESADGVSATQCQPAAPERVHSTCLPQQDGLAAAERDPLGSRDDLGLEGEQQMPHVPTTQPGSLLLVTEPLPACRQWGVVVAREEELPVDQSGAVSAPFELCPPVFQAHSEPGNCALIPALILGSKMLVWVASGACCPFDPGRLRETHCPARCDRSAEAMAVHSIKIATQLLSCCHHQAAAQRLTQAAGISLVSDGLLDVERRLPMAAMRTHAFAFWDGWRCSVARAKSPEDLIAQVLLLGQQLLPEVLLAAPSGSCSGAEVLQNRLALAAHGADGIGGSNKSAKSHEVPTAREIDRAIKAIEGCIDWQAMQQLWMPSQAALGVGSIRSASHQECTKAAGLDVLPSVVLANEGDHASATEDIPRLCMQPELHVQPLEPHEDCSKL
ncbi:hypothetical protein WJX74_006194 [Apatococcus lobatus]|uniref:CW-type domain-containing protein n=1 Tax=Apatococcus lobatus TaxID=904363 RepID=A0AAW1QK73_9CHLO